MKNYYSKIRELEKKIEMLRNTYRDLCIEKNRLVDYEKSFKRIR